MKRILLHEPEVIIALDLQNLLKNYEIIRNTKSIYNVVDLLEVEKFDLVILDISGSEDFCNILHYIKNVSHLPFIVISSSSDTALYDEYTPFIIQCPFNSEELISAVNKSLYVN